MRTLRVAFVDLYRQWPAYFVDTLTARYAARLSDAGHDVSWQACYLHSGDASPFEALLADLDASPPVDLLVIERIWDRSLLQALVSRGRARHVVCLQWELPSEWTEVDYRITPTNGAALETLADRIRTDQSPEGIPNLWRKQHDRWTPPLASRPLSVSDELTPHGGFFYHERLHYGLDDAEVWGTRFLLLNMGCPYRTAKNESGFLDGLDMPTSWGAQGCTFCSVGPYERQSAAARRQLITDQLTAMASHGPFERLVVIDEFIFRDIDTLIDCVVKTFDFPITLMVRARPDYLFTYEVQLERALSQLGSSGTLAPYLIGFENFSDAELSRYNKGLTAQDMTAAVKRLHALSEAHDNFELSPSNGFILFGPWTTLADLDDNVEALRGLGFRALRGNLLSSKLRLYPDTALVARAMADGLVSKEFSTPDQANSPVTGYQAEIPYRFAHRETAEVWEMLHGPTPVEGPDELTRLQRALSAVRTRGSEV